MADDTNQIGTGGTPQENDEQETKNLSAENQAYMKELEELEKARKEHEEKKKEELDRMRKEHEKKKDKKEGEGEEQEKAIPGHTPDKLKKVFSVEKKIFRHNRINDFGGSGATKIDKALKKAHLSSDKRRDLIETLSAYNPSHSVLKKKDFIDFTRRFKSKSFFGTKFQQAKKEIDLKEMRSRFSKRDLDKFRRAVTGEKNPNQYSGKPRTDTSKKPGSNPASKH
ncbi:MAG: hypothetical protein WA063_03175 [Minisyncoccia bacterium]